jgi:hypothetical protein
LRNSSGKPVFWDAFGENARAPIDVHERPKPLKAELSWSLLSEAPFAEATSNNFNHLQSIPAHLHSGMVTMSQKSSILQPAKPVSLLLAPDGLAINTFRSSAFTNFSIDRWRFRVRNLPSRWRDATVPLGRGFFSGDALTGYETG